LICWILILIAIRIVTVDDYMQETVSMLKLFEKDCMDTYITHEKKKREESVDNKIASLEEK
jgi:hypothetical protein